MLDYLIIANSKLQIANIKQITMAKIRYSTRLPSMAYIRYNGSILL